MIGQPPGLPGQLLLLRRAGQGRHPAGGEERLHVDQPLARAARRPGLLRPLRLLLGGGRLAGEVETGRDGAGQQEQDQGGEPGAEAHGAWNDDPGRG